MFSLKCRRQCREWTLLAILSLVKGGTDDWPKHAFPLNSFSVITRQEAYRMKSIFAIPAWEIPSQFRNSPRPIIKNLEGKGKIRQCQWVPESKNVFYFFSSLAPQPIKAYSFLIIQIALFTLLLPTQQNSSHRSSMV